MSLKLKLLTKLQHPIWWEDVFPGALRALPKIALRVAAIPTMGLHALGI